MRVNGLFSVVFTFCRLKRRPRLGQRYDLQSHCSEWARGNGPEREVQFQLATGVRTGGADSGAKGHAHGSGRAHDNSANNPYNPDPTKEVVWGNLTSDEMVLPWLGVIVDKNADPERILSIRQDGCGINDGVIAPLPARTPTLPFPLPTRR